MEKLSFTEEIQTNRLILRKRKATKKYAEKLSTLIKENQNFLKIFTIFLFRVPTFPLTELPFILDEMLCSTLHEFNNLYKKTP